MAAPVTKGDARSSGYQRQNFSAIITDAKGPTSAEQSTRMRRYAITMAFRTGCFIAMIFVPGILRWILFACAVFLPYIAVLLANQAHTKVVTNTVEKVAPSNAPQLMAGPVEGETISGDVIDDDADGSNDRARPGDHSEDRGRVA